MISVLFLSQLLPKLEGTPAALFRLMTVSRLLQNLTQGMDASCLQDGTVTPRCKRCRTVVATHVEHERLGGPGRAACMAQLLPNAASVLRRLPQSLALRVQAPRVQALRALRTSGQMRRYIGDAYSATTLLHTACSHVVHTFRARGTLS